MDSILDDVSRTITAYNSVGWEEFEISQEFMIQLGKVLLVYYSDDEERRDQMLLDEMPFTSVVHILNRMERVIQRDPKWKEQVRRNLDTPESWMDWALRLLWPWNTAKIDKHQRHQWEIILHVVEDIDSPLRATDDLQWRLVNHHPITGSRVLPTETLRKELVKKDVNRNWSILEQTLQISCVMKVGWGNHTEEGEEEADLTEPEMDPDEEREWGKVDTTGIVGYGHGLWKQMIQGKCKKEGTGRTDKQETRVIKEEESLLQCPICLTTLQELSQGETELVVMPCGHITCDSCFIEIAIWGTRDCEDCKNGREKCMRKHWGSCPTCMKKIEFDDVRRIFM